jgi:hypothetical protein
MTDSHKGNINAAFISYTQLSGYQEHLTLVKIPATRMQDNPLNVHI